MLMFWHILQKGGQMTKEHRPDFLIVGLQKAGTTWLSNMLSMHSDINCVPSWPDHPYEWQFFGRLKKKAIDGRNIRIFSLGLSEAQSFIDEVEMGAVNLRGNAQRDFYVKSYFRLCEMYRKDKKMFGEKSPSYVFHLSFIDKFCQVKKICMIRNVKDRIVSAYFMKLSSGERKGVCVPEDFVRKYSQRVKQEYKALVKYEGDVLCIRYEDLLHNTRETFCKVLQYLDASNDNVDSIIEKNKFDRLKSAMLKSDFENNNKKEAVIKHLRVGKEKSWKNHLSEKHSRLLEQDKQLRELQGQLVKKFEIG